MINKTQNVSFKQAIITPSIMNMKPVNVNKLDVAVELINKFFPQNDVFLGSNQQGELIYQIKKSEPLLALFDKEVLQKTKTNPAELAALINMCRIFKAIHNAAYDIKEQSMDFSTKNIDIMKRVEIARKIKNSLIEFNKKYPETKN